MKKKGDLSLNYAVSLILAMIIFLALIFAVYINWHPNIDPNARLNFNEFIQTYIPCLDIEGEGCICSYYNLSNLAYDHKIIFSKMVDSNGDYYLKAYMQVKDKELGELYQYFEEEELCVVKDLNQFTKVDEGSLVFERSREKLGIKYIALLKTKEGATCFYPFTSFEISNVVALLDCEKPKDLLVLDTFQVNNPSPVEDFLVSMQKGLQEKVSEQVKITPWIYERDLQLQTELDKEPSLIRADYYLPSAQDRVDYLVRELDNVNYYINVFFGAKKTDFFIIVYYIPGNEESKKLAESVVNHLNGNLKDSTFAKIKETGLQDSEESKNSLKEENKLIFELQNLVTLKGINPLNKKKETLPAISIYINEGYYNKAGLGDTAKTTLLRGILGGVINYVEGNAGEVVNPGDLTFEPN